MVAYARRQTIREIAGSMRAARRDYLQRRNARPFCKVYEEIHEAFRTGDLKLEDLSIAEIFEATVPDGRELRALYGNGSDPSLRVLLSEAEAVKLSDFAAVLLPALSGETMREYELAELVHDQLVTTIQTTLERERIPGVGGIGDQAKVIQEGDPYPLAGLAPDWVDTPPTQKRGFIIGITKEMVTFDRTNLVVRRCQQTAKWMLVNKEKRVLSMVAGATNTYRYRDVAYNTYQNGGAGELYDNTAGSNPFVDWRSIQTAEMLFSNMRDPMTGEPLSMGVGRTIICSPELEARIRMTVGATEVRTVSDTNPALGTPSTGLVTISRNPVRPYTVLASRYFADQVGNTTTWLLGNFREAFAYLQNWGITTEQAGANSDLAFRNDIIMQFKASERGTPAVIAPMGVVINTA